MRTLRALLLLILPRAFSSSTPSTTLFRLPVNVEGTTQTLPDLVFKRGGRVTPTAREYVMENAELLSSLRLGTLDSFTAQLTTHLRNHIDENSTVLPPPAILPLLAFVPTACADQACTESASLSMRSATYCDMQLT